MPLERGPIQLYPERTPIVIDRPEMQMTGDPINLTSEQRELLEQEENLLGYKLEDIYTISSKPENEKGGKLVLYLDYFLTPEGQQILHVLYHFDGVLLEAVKDIQQYRLTLQEKGEISEEEYMKITMYTLLERNDLKVALLRNFVTLTDEDDDSEDEEEKDTAKSSKKKNSELTYEELIQKEFGMVPDLQINRPQSYLEKTLKKYGLINQVDTGRVKQMLYITDFSHFPREMNRLLMGVSKQYARKIFLESFHSSDNNIDRVIDPERINVQANPVGMLVTQYIAYRELKIQLKSYIQNATTPAGRELTNLEEREAWSMIYSMYSERINALLVDIYKDAIPFIEKQKFFAGNALRFDEEVKLLTLIQADRLGPTSLGLLRNVTRFDKFIYGVEQQSETVLIDSSSEDIDDLTFLTSRVKPQIISQLMTFASVAPSEAEAYTIAEPTNALMERYGFDIEKLVNYELTFDDAKAIVEHYFQTHSELSTWTVLKSESADSMSCNSLKKRVNIPASFKRALPTALTTISHELEHVVQRRNKSTIPLRLLKKVGGTRGMAIAEAGAMRTQEMVEETFFREHEQQRNTLPLNKIYLQGAIARLRRGSFKHVFNAMLKAKPSSPEIEKKIFGNALRLFPLCPLNDTSGNLTNSKDLVYLEQRMIAKQIPKNLEYILDYALPPRWARMLEKLGYINPENRSYFTKVDAEDLLIFFRDSHPELQAV